MKHIPPQPWETVSGDTPDTQPGFWGVTLPPSDGKTYLSMVCRGPGYDSWEACGQKLLTPLVSNSCYKLSVDLAFSKQFFGIDWDTVWFDKPSNFRVWCAPNIYTESELLWESGVITNITWQKFTAILRPLLNGCDYLILDACWNTTDHYFGNILVDKISLSDLELNYLMLDTMIAYGAYLTLPASQGMSYSWYPSIGLSCTDCQSPLASPFTSTTYTAIVNYSNGCSYSETFDIAIEISVPNVFTPNHDGKNDLFIIQRLESNYNVKIINRWGNTVFENNNYANDWDGKSKSGIALSDGVYFYEIKSENRHKIWRGYFYLLL